MRPDVSRLLRQIGLDIDQATTDPRRWDASLAGIGELTGAAGVALFRPLAAPNAGPVALQGMMRPGATRYWDHWVQQDPWNAAAKGTLLFQTAGEVLDGRDYLSDAAYRRTDYYEYYARHHDSGHKLFLKVCDAADPVAPVTHLTLSRSFKQPAFDDECRRLLRHLWPRLRQAVRAHAVLQRLPHVGDLAASAIEQLPHPSWILRVDGTMDFASRSAETAMQLSASVDNLAGSLVRIGPWDRNALRALLARAASGEAHHSPIAVQGARGGPLQRATLRILPLRESQLYAATWPQAVALLVLELPAEQESLDSAWIRSQLVAHYHLTPNECQTLEWLVAGHAIPQIASLMGISDVTVRTHLRGLREKTGRRTQGDLIRLGLGR